jgi:sensor histidine kinase YesM
MKQEKLNDVGFRIVLIPFFGIAIPLITGMVNVSSFNNWGIKFSFLYTIGIAFVVWQGNRYLLFSLRSYFDWLNKPVRKIIVLLLAVSFFTIPVSTLLMVGWFHLFTKGIVNWDMVLTATLIIMICVIFITHVYETVFLVKQAETDKVKAEQLERSRVQAELSALKSQIDPHFIFNSLNTLSHLIESDARKAKLFNDNLADVYRYILQNKGSDLVLLREEMNFVQDYFSLLKIRFEDAVELENKINSICLDQYLIPPISLQILLENAIKHNDFSDLAPLKITIELQDDSLMMKHELRKRTLHKPSSKTGLQNLSERYKLITNQDIRINDNASIFEVQIPVLKIT